MKKKGDFTEAWKAVIEFSKTVLTFSSAVIVAIIGYYLVNDVPKARAIWPILLLLFSALASLYGFGRAMGAVNQGAPSDSALNCCNISVFLLLAGVISACFLKPSPSSSFPEAYNDAKAELKGIGVNVDFTSVKMVEYKEGLLTLVMASSNHIKQATYDAKRKHLVKVETRSQLP